jgi:hypothetical protein
MKYSQNKKNKIEEESDYLFTNDLTDSQGPEFQTINLNFL